MSASNTRRKQTGMNEGKNNALNNLKLARKGESNRLTQAIDVK
jgi:hypothetical protein